MYSKDRAMPAMLPPARLMIRTLQSRQFTRPDAIYERHKVLALVLLMLQAGAVTASDPR